MAQFDKEISIDINNAVFDNLKTTAEYTVNARYSASVFKGFYYKNLRRHTEYPFLYRTLDTYDVEGQIERNLSAGLDLVESFNEMAKDLKLAFENTLMTPEFNTLKWWHETWRPWEHVHLELGDVPESSYDAADYPQ